MASAPSYHNHVENSTVGTTENEIEREKLRPVSTDRPSRHSLLAPHLSIAAAMAYQKTYKELTTTASSWPILEIK